MHPDGTVAFASVVVQEQDLRVLFVARGSGPDGFEPEIPDATWS